MQKKRKKKQSADVDECSEGKCDQRYRDKRNACGKYEVVSQIVAWMIYFRFGFLIRDW